MITTKRKKDEVTKKGQYSAQISVDCGVVTAEILCLHSGYKDPVLELWRTVADKRFNGWLGLWRSTPREVDFINAHKWIKEYFLLLEKYATAIITKPQSLVEYDRRREEMYE